ncbi:MAG: ATP-dependent helicase HrpB [Microthrixaceae bacterium]
MTDSSAGDTLPALAVIGELRAALDGPGAAVLVAPPGTGKTTAVPPALLDEAWVGGGRLLVVEPRRLAARAAASRMADVAGEPVGLRFGYSVRGDRSVSPDTRVEVVTEGLFLRRLQSDPELTGVAAVLLDEFHERSIDTDLSLAMLADVRGSLRPDLRLIVMSATIDPEPVATLLRPDHPVPVVRATAPLFPVETRYRPGSAHDPLEDRVTTVVLEALRADPGDLLVFLPGRPEIHRCARRLAAAGLAAGIRVAELHGSLSPAEQEAVVAHDPDSRRVILSTSLAETSITVPGVRVVIDAGRRRTVRTDAHTGLPAMTTVAASRASADQRRGRAGRLGPGVAYRLWAESDERHRPAADTPEIIDGDLAPLLLQLRAWGVSDPSELVWLDPPPAEPLERAATLLSTLGALDGDGALTPLGRDMAGIGFHPRLAAIALAADRDGTALAAELLAILETSRSGEVDIAERVRSLRRGDAPGDARHALSQWRRTLRAERGASGSGDALDAEVARLLLAGFPDRVARRRGTARRDDRGREVTVFHLRSGGEVSVPGGVDAHHLAAADWLVVADLDAGATGRSGRLHLGAAVSASVVLDRLGDQIRIEDVVDWDPDRGDLRAVRRRTLGAITVDEEALRQPPADLVAAAVRRAVVQDLSLLGRWEQASPLRARVAFLRATQGDGWPDWSDEALAASVDEWLGPFLGRARRRSDLARIDVAGALGTQLDWAQRRRLDELAPTRWQLAGGRSVALEYGMLGGDPGSVTMSARLRDLLGTDSHPTVAGVPVSVELLSPAGRPLQRTADLPGFWRGSYAQVRAEMRGRYPKHPWPERPWEQR